MQTKVRIPPFVRRISVKGAPTDVDMLDVDGKTICTIKPLTSTPVSLPGDAMNLRVEQTAAIRLVFEKSL